MVYLLLLFVTGAILVRYVYKFTSIVTLPASGDYVELLKNAMVSNDETTNTNIETQFMQFIANLGIQSLNAQTGVGYFYLPKIGSVYVLSEQPLINQLYAEQNKANFSQLRFFNTLALILGPNNLMSSPLSSAAHSRIRTSIYERNEKFIPHTRAVVTDFFQKYAMENKAQSLSAMMDALSRRVLLSNYFDECLVDFFEKHYEPQLSKDLLASIFQLEELSTEKHKSILELRNKLFKFSCDLLLLPEIKNKIFAKNTWLNYLLQVRIEENPALLNKLFSLNISNSPENLQAADWEILLHYAINKQDTDELSALVRDVVCESFFIPLLGFDATATMLITSLRIAIQDPRIKAIVTQEIKQLSASNPSLSLLGTNGSYKLSYMEAIILEGLRLSPPAPIIPEIVTNTFYINTNGQKLKLPKDSLIFIPMEGLHTHSANYPDIPLSKKGQDMLHTMSVDSKTVFPERWKPVDPEGTQYNADYFSQPHSAPKAFSPFKLGARQCPGKRLAMSEAISVFTVLDMYDFQLTNEDTLNFPYSYDKPFQRNGGEGALKIMPVAMPVNATTPSPTLADRQTFFTNISAINNSKNAITQDSEDILPNKQPRI